MTLRTSNDIVVIRCENHTEETYSSSEIRSLYRAASYAFQSGILMTCPHWGINDQTHINSFDLRSAGEMTFCTTILLKNK